MNAETSPRNTGDPGMRFVITGCARSGTKYTAHLLTRAGIATGHEDVFNRWGEAGALQAGWRDDSFDGDSSYIAAPHAAELREAGLTVIHLVRPPLAVVASITTMGWLGNLDAPYVAYVAAHLPELAEIPPGPRRAAAYWLGWNALVEDHSHLTWRTGHVDELDIHHLADIIGVKVAKTRVSAALARTSKATNHKREVRPVELDELGPFAERVAAGAERYQVALA